MSPKVRRQLEYIFQFTSDIRYLPGAENVPADALSRIGAMETPTVVSYQEVATGQEQGAEEVTAVKRNRSNFETACTTRIRYNNLL